MAFPSASPTFGRRNLFRLVPAAFLVAACAPRADEPDPLLDLDHTARSDAALARSVAKAHPQLAEPANLIAEVRSQHARALRREIDRMNPPDPDAPGPKNPDQPAAPGSASQASQKLTSALRSAQRSAGTLVPNLANYRAGLTGSISASCAGLLEVLG